MRLDKIAAFPLANIVSAYGMLIPGLRDGLQLGYDQLGVISTANFAGYLVAASLTGAAVVMCAMLPSHNAVRQHCPT